MAVNIAASKAVNAGSGTTTQAARRNSRIKRVPGAGKIRNKELPVFTRQLAAMLAFSLLYALASSARFYLLQSGGHMIVMSVPMATRRRRLISMTWARNDSRSRS